MCDKSVTFIIPVFKLKEHRINNLKFILPHLVNTGKKVLVVEQVDKNESELSAILSKFPSVEHRLFITNEQRFHKSGIINWAVINHVNTKYAWINDVDYYMKYIDVLKQDWTELFIQPYESAKKLDETVSKMICEGNTVNIDYNDETAVYLSMYGALSFIFDVYAFISAGAMDESIFEWGKEDVELFDRISKKHNIQILNFKGIHLYHPVKNEVIKVGVEHEKDLAIVTCYFNWCGFANPIKNLHRFIDQMQVEKVPLYGIELSLTDEFETVGINGWKQIKVSKENVCFQKEACINLAVSELVPSNYTKIAWVDADLTFTNPNWYRDTSISLDKYKAVQMFSVYLYTDEYGKVTKKIPSIMKNGGPRKETLNSFTAKHLNGVPGGAWAARRELWSNGGLYPYAFVGGGDCAFIYSLYGLESEDLVKTIIGISGRNEKCFKFSIWKSNIVSYIAGSISHVNGEVVHSWHGDTENKAYNTRHQLYQLVSIDGDVQCPEDGILSIHGGNLEVYDKIFSYFNNRKEDGHHSTPTEATIAKKDMAVVTCHFNWCNYLNPTRNLNRFIRQMEIQSIPLFGIELSLDGTFYTTGRDNWKQIKVSKENVCFQKEACINLAVNKLVPSNYTKIAWIDCDLAFTNPDWYEDACEKLKKYKLVQLFQSTIETDRYGREINTGSGSVCCGGPHRKGGRRSPGGAWAARRELWSHGGLFPYCPLGGGDTAFLYAIYDGSTPTTLGYLDSRPDYADWKKRICKYASNSISYIRGSFIHEWHGDKDHRNYKDRQLIFQKIPHQNIELNSSGIIEIKNEKRSVYKEIYDYFRNRNEDGVNEINECNKKYDYCIVITTYQRKQMLETLLDDIKNNTVGKKAMVVVFDDGTDDSIDPSLYDIKYIKYVNNHGKKNFWKLIDDTFKYLKNIDAKYYFYLQDDVRLSNNFFENAIRIYDGIPDKNKVSLGTLIVNSQLSGRKWTHFDPIYFGEYYKTQWCELFFVAEKKFFEKLNYEILKIDESRWENNLLLGSGVGDQISNRLDKIGAGMYHVAYSLVGHGDHTSKMNPHDREITKLIVNI